MCVYIYICIHLYTCICVYIYIYIYMLCYIYIYTHTYVHTAQWRHAPERAQRPVGVPTLDTRLQDFPRRKNTQTKQSSEEQPGDRSPRMGISFWLLILRAGKHSATGAIPQSPVPWLACAESGHRLSRAENPPTPSYSLVTKQAVTRGLLNKWDIPTLFLTGTSGSGSFEVRPISLLTLSLLTLLDSNFLANSLWT